MKDNIKIIRTILFVIFFFSGISALIYQIIWIKMLGQVFGLTLFAVSTVLTAFMAGIALGSYLFGKLIDKTKDPLFIFFLLQLGIGLFALLFPGFLKLLSELYFSITQNAVPDLYTNTIMRFIASFILLLFPTTLMGGTLPVISKYFVKNLNQLGGNVANLYAVNNLGAVIGCFVVSFILVQITGLSRSHYIAAFINVFIAVIIFIIWKKSPEPVQQETMPSKQEPLRAAITKPGDYPAPVLRLVLWVFAIEGFTTLAYEVIWTRILLGISYDRSVYFYSTVIISFIMGLSLGSFIAALFVDKKKNLVFLLGVIEILIGIIACAVLIVFVQISGYLNLARPGYTQPWLTSLGKEYFIFFLLMIIPTTLMGLTFPIVARIYTTNIEKLGRKLGIIGCLDTIGSIFGSFAAGFILVPFIGVVKSLIFTAALNVILGIALVIFNPHSKQKIKIITITAAVIVVLLTTFSLPQENYFRHWQTEEEGDRLLYYKEGLGSTVAVAQKFDGVKELAIDGAVTAIAEYGDIRVHKLLAYLPYLLCEKPANALVVGFGMGITTQSLIQDDMNQVTCVEICTEIINGSSQYFSKENKDVLKEPKLKIVIEDGRSYMAMIKDKFDVITTNAVHPRLSINIYTREFYKLCRDHLSDQGVMCQWIATNWVSEKEYKMLLKSFIDVFPETSLWISNIGHVLLVGTPAPLKIDYKVLEQKMKRTKILNDLKEVHLDDPALLLALYGCGKDELIPYLSDAAPATDDYPLPEFSKYISTNPNLEITDELFRYNRNIKRITDNWPDTETMKKTEQNVQAEKYYLKARYDSFQSSVVDTTVNLEKAISLNPRNYMFRQVLGNKYMDSGEYERAVEEYKSLIKLDENCITGYLDIANAYLKLKKYDDVVTSIKKAIEIDSESGLAHYFLSIIYRIKDQKEEASMELEIVTKYFPGFKNAFYELAEIYFVMGKYKQAKTAIVRYAEMVPDDKDVEFLFKELKKQGY